MRKSQSSQARHIIKFLFLIYHYNQNQMVGMVKKVSLVMAILVFLVLPIISAEISVNIGSTGTSALQDPHSFVVNTLISSASSPNQNLQQPPIQGIQGRSIVIEQINSARIIAPCGQANFSFKIMNQNQAQQIYTLSVKDFEGTAFITPNLMLNPKEAKIIDMILVPECSGTITLNPVVHVETDDEEADIPFIINVNGTYIDSDSCNYYYNDSVCNSPYYIRINKGGSYNLDLSKWFYDPDTDKLEYTASKSSNLDITISGSKARIKQVNDWLGTEKITFSANDGKGGIAVSKTFYLHAVSQEESAWNKFLNLLGI
jgi:hypothetical protein